MIYVLGGSKFFMDNVVITGMGIVSPIGCGEEAFWTSLCEGRSAAAPVDGLNCDELPRKIACQVRESMDIDEPIGRASKLAVRAGRDAVTSAGLSTDDLTANRLHVVMGTTRSNRSSTRWPWRRSSRTW